MNGLLFTALAPGFVTAGASVAVMPFLKHERHGARLVMIGISLILMARYFIWRVTETLPDAGLTIDFVTGLAFLVLESLALVAAVLALMFLSRTRNRSAEVEANKPWLAGIAPPLVDLFICTYNEEEAILERTIVGATGLDYPNYRVWVLDDGKREWLRDLSERVGCRYLTRSDNAHAKAGNINHALAHVARLSDPPVFISILDADFVPLPQFLSRALCLFKDPTVGLVQTPQHFINPDPIQVNLSAGHVWPDEQRFFFDVVLASKDAWGAAFCCGTSSIIRFAPLMALGGFPTDSVTEDYLLTLRLKEANLTTSYLNEPLTLGLAPEGLKEFITQRGRWCLGFMQIARGRSGPLSRTSSLSFIDRLSLVDAFLSWTAVYTGKLFCAAGADRLPALRHPRRAGRPRRHPLPKFLPYFVWQSATMQLGLARPVAHLHDRRRPRSSSAPTILKAVFAGLLRPQGQKFKVTAKGGDRGKRFVEWNLLTISSAAFVVAEPRRRPQRLHAERPGATPSRRAGSRSLGPGTTFVILVVVCVVCIEQPRLPQGRALPRPTSRSSWRSSGRPTRGAALRHLDHRRAAAWARLRRPSAPRLACTIRGREVLGTIARDLGGRLTR